MLIVFQRVANWIPKQASKSSFSFPTILLPIAKHLKLYSTLPYFPGRSKQDLRQYPLLSIYNLHISYIRCYHFYLYYQNMMKLTVFTLWGFESPTTISGVSLPPQRNFPRKLSPAKKTVLMYLFNYHLLFTFRSSKLIPAINITVTKTTGWKLIRLYVTLFNHSQTKNKRSNDWTYHATTVFQLAGEESYKIVINAKSVSTGKHAVVILYKIMS